MNGSGSLLLLLLLESLHHVTLGFLAKGLDGLFFRQIISSGHDCHLLRAWLVTSSDLDFRNTVELFERRTDVRLTTSSSNAGHSDDVSNRLFLLLSETGNKSDSQG